MAKFVIEGQKLLRGEIEVYGAKNAAMKMMAAAILINGPVLLENVPEISDIENLGQILKLMGAQVRRRNHQLTIDTRKMNPSNPNNHLVRAML